MTSTVPLYPLRFRPLFKRYLWGGRRLGTVLGKPIGEGSDYAESWEVADHGVDQSVVAEGPLAGKTLHELVAHRGAELLGQHAPQSRFPLLFKYLDCNQVLSVQVHPDDSRAALLDPPDLGKTEAWLILDARPGSVVYAGLKSGVDRPALERAMKADKVEQCLHSYEPQPGDCLFIPAGTVHALGAGLLVAEIQQASNTTYRLHDWGRLGPDGQPRQLHVAEALEAIDFSKAAARPQRAGAASAPQCDRLVTCDKFVLDRWTLEGSHTKAKRERGPDPPQSIGGDNRFHILSVLAGELHLGEDQFTRGQTILLPACLPAQRIASQGRCTFLDMYLP